MDGEQQRRHNRNRLHQHCALHCCIAPMMIHRMNIAEMRTHTAWVVHSPRCGLFRIWVPSLFLFRPSRGVFDPAAHPLPRPQAMVIRLPHPHTHKKQGLTVVMLKELQGKMTHLMITVKLQEKPVKMHTHTHSFSTSTAVITYGLGEEPPSLRKLMGSVPPPLGALFAPSRSGNTRPSSAPSRDCILLSTCV